VHVVSGFGIDGVPSTKTALGTIAALTQRTHVLVVTERSDELTHLSLRNLEQVHLLHADQLNTYDVLVSDDVVFTEAALQAFLAGPATGKSVKAVATEAEVEAASEKEATK
jgi:large subunit ribosomal protein L4